MTAEGAEPTGSGSRPRGRPAGPVAEDYLKAVWSATEWGGPAITVRELAERFSVTTATASGTVKRLAGQGLIVHEPYGDIVLTGAGQRRAIQVVRRHRLLETFLVTALHYGWDEVHDEAETLEHAVSDLMVQRIDDFLERPEQDPHGDPIPAADGRVRYPTGAVRLADAVLGRYRVARVSDADSPRLGYFQELGLVPGAPLEVIARDQHANTVLLTVDGRSGIALSHPASDALLLLPRSPSGPS